MGRFVLRRMLESVPTLFLASVLVFLVVYLTPGDPVQILMGPDVPRDQIANLRRDLGLEDPLVVQYVRWLGRVLQLDLGVSFINRQPVWDLIKRRIPATTELACSALVLSILVGVPLGAAAAVRRDTWVDNLVTALNSLALALPVFWIGMLLLTVFSLQLGWLPPSGRVGLTENPAAALRSLALPVVTLAIPTAALLARFLRSALIDVFAQDYVRTARAKGLRERGVVYGHALRNALIPVVTALGIQFGHLLGGAVVVESVFTWPGLGRLVLFGIANKDYTVVQGTLLFVVAVFILANLIVDVLYGVIDPRIRVARR